MADPSCACLDYICALFGSSGDDRIENSSPPSARANQYTSGGERVSEAAANYKSPVAFQLKKILDNEQISVVKTINSW